jgi:hypothetical protein
MQSRQLANKIEPDLDHRLHRRLAANGGLASPVSWRASAPKSFSLTAYYCINRHQNAKRGPSSEAMACLMRGSLCSVSPGANAIQSDSPC